MQFLEKLLKMWEKIKLVTTEKRKNCLVSEPNYHTRKFFTEYILVKEIKKTEILINKLVCLLLSILESSKTLMYYFFYNYIFLWI